MDNVFFGDGASLSVSSLAGFVGVAAFEVSWLGWRVPFAVLGAGFSVIVPL
jgi:hypothetical protein